MGTKITPPTTKFNLIFPLGFFFGGGGGLAISASTGSNHRPTETSFGMWLWHATLEIRGSIPVISNF